MSFLNWGFRATVKLHQAEPEHSRSLKLRSGETVPFSDFVKDRLSIVDPSKKLWLNPLLFNGSLQTLYYAMHDLLTSFQVHYGRELFQYADDGQCSLDWVIPAPESKASFDKLYKETLPEDSPRLHPRTRFFTPEEAAQRRQAGQQEGSDEPICVILHGLGGGSNEPLIRNVAEYLAKKDGHTKWDTVVINLRGCCRTKITTGRLFTGFSTDDIGEVLVELKRRYPTRPIFAVGFSFGAVLLANYLGLGAKDPLVKAACLIGCPWDMSDLAYHLMLSWTGAYMLSPSLVLFLNKIIKNNFSELNKHNPEMFTKERLDKGFKMKETWQWDALYTCRLVGYSSSFEYYRKASPINRIGDISVPTLIINSTDDPAVSVRLPVHEVPNNPNLCLVETNLGGHLGFVKANGAFWCSEVADEFFARFHADVE